MQQMQLQTRQLYLVDFSNFTVAETVGTTEADKVLQLGNSLKLAISNVKPDLSIAASRNNYQQLKLQRRH